MIDLQVSAKQIKQLELAIRGVRTKLDREIATALNATAKKVTTQVSRALRTEINVKAKILKKIVRSKKKASKNSKTAVIHVWEGHPIPLKHFGARQTKKMGVTWRTSKSDKNRRRNRSAFMPPQYGGHVYERISGERGPLRRLHGPSPGQFFEQTKVRQVAIKTAKIELPKQMDRRIKLMLLRASGQVPQRGRG